MGNGLGARLYFDSECFCLSCRGIGIITSDKNNIICSECLGKGDRLLYNPIIRQDIRNVIKRNFGQYYICGIFADLTVAGGVLYFLYHDWCWRTDPDFQGCGRHFPDKTSAKFFLASAVRDN